MVWTRIALAAAVVVVLASFARANSEIVVAIRYLRASGVSHAHLYLYREDGKLLRQLTRDDSGQDSAPQFAPDGETIVWMREKPGGASEYFEITPRGGGLRRLTAPPAWYVSKKRSDFFTNFAVAEPDASPDNHPINPTFRTPDGSFEIVLRSNTDDEDDKGVAYGSHHLLRAVRTGKTVEFAALPGFDGAHEMLHDISAPPKYFLWEEGLHLAFFETHLNSTDGDTVYALDFAAPRLTRLSPNWAAPFPLPGEPAFLSLTENRYVPIARTQKTANCSYMERWDRHLHKIRYARPRAAVCYGASLYRPEGQPAVVTVRSSGAE